MKARVYAVLGGVTLLMLGAIALTALAEKDGRREAMPRPTLLTQEGYFRVRDVPSNDVLWIRRGRGAKYEKIGAIPYNGRCVTVLDEGNTGGWETVYFRGINGYSSARYLELDDQEYCEANGDRDRCEDNSNNMRVVNVSEDDVLWIRKKADSNGEKVGAIPFNGSCVLYLGKSGSWNRVKYRGVTGYAHSSYLAWDR